MKTRILFLAYSILIDFGDTEWDIPFFSCHYRFQKHINRINLGIIA